MSISKYILGVSLAFLSWSAMAQQNEATTSEAKQTKKKSIELGIGGDMLNISRMYLNDYKSSNKGDAYALQIRNVMFAGNLYLAHELTPWLYADLQASLGWVEALKAEKKLFGLGGLGLQFRLTPLFGKKYVEPYLRIGANYFYKDFDLTRNGELKNYQGDFLHWQHSDWFNKQADKSKGNFLASAGIGVNSWFNDCVGFGIQADYLTGFDKEKLNFPRVLARVMFRWGASKEPQRAVIPPVIEYRDRVVKEFVPKEVIKYVEKDCDPLYLLFANVNFEFDKADITAESAQVLDQAAAIMKKHPNLKFLITGHTDIRGSVSYNEKLAARRAAPVVSALEERGVDPAMIKSRGVGKKIAVMPYGETHKVREGDRKVTVEVINTQEYWDKLPKKSY